MFNEYPNPDATGGRGARAAVLGVLALAVGLPTGYLAYAASASVAVAGTGYVLDPPGRIVATDDGPVVEFPETAYPRLTLRVPVVNTSRVPLDVRYETDVAPPPRLTETGDWPTATVRVPAGGTAWLELAHGDHGCAAARLAAQGGTLTVGAVRVWVRAPGGTERVRHLALPVPYAVPQAELPEQCLGGAG